MAPEKSAPYWGLFTGTVLDQEKVLSWVISVEIKALCCS